MKSESKWPIHEDSFNIIADAVIVFLILFFLFALNWKMVIWARYSWYQGANNCIILEIVFKTRLFRILL